MDAVEETLAEVTEAVRHAGPGPTLVGIDGVDGVGKTTMADALAQALRDVGRPVVRVCLDDFLRPRSQRYARGRESAEGFYLDSIDIGAFQAAVVEPLRTGHPIRTAVFDYRTDHPVDVDPVQIPPDGVVVVDGLFLHRRELAAIWDVSVYLYAPFEITVARMAARDGTSADPGAPQNARYVAGQRLYLDECRPTQLATLVIDMTDLAAPRTVPGVDLDPQ